MEPKYGYFVSLVVDRKDMSKSYVVFVSIQKSICM